MSQLTEGGVPCIICHTSRGTTVSHPIEGGREHHVSSDSGQAPCLIKWGLSGGYHVSFDS